ncbi:MAG: isoprenylcysteine carboxylmethyltransferase family protein [Pseudoxanthomonas sp.]|nr:isoprenylcysteine carboxylmethyltransferase family protein [Pseudoxanthomonas sp.]
MPSLFDIGLTLCWFAVIGYWLWSARNVKRPQRTESRSKRLLAYWLPLAVAVLLLAPGDGIGHGLLRGKFVPDTMAVRASGLLLCVAGAVLAIASRHLLGRNWSGTVQLKQDHELVETGPYRHVRHPIYSGLLLLFLGNAVMVGAWRGLLAVAIVAVSFWFKLRQEERWLAAHFGPAYEDYRRRTWALVPGLL